MHQILMFIDSGIDTQSLEAVEKQLKNKSGDKLYLILQSPGGDPFSAARIMNILQNKFKEIISIVPSSATSAATLMALGTDMIYMDNKSMLGPLDLPIEHPKDGSRISALDVQNTITTLSSLSEAIAQERYESLRKEGRKISKLEASKLALDVATQFVKPIVEQIDPYHLQKSYRELRIGLSYALDLLTSRMMKDNFSQAVKTARSLVNDYPAHEYGILFGEAKDTLKLNVKKMSDLVEWNEGIEEEYEKVCRKSYHIEYKEIKDQKDATSSKKPKK